MIVRLPMQQGVAGSLSNSSPDRGADSGWSSSDERLIVDKPRQLTDLRRTGSDRSGQRPQQPWCKNRKTTYEHRAGEKQLFPIPQLKMTAARKQTVLYLTITALND